MFKQKTHKTWFHNSILWRKISDESDYPIMLLLCYFFTQNKDHTKSFCLFITLHHPTFALHGVKLCSILKKQQHLFINNRPISMNQVKISFPNTSFDTHFLACSERNCGICLNITLTTSGWVSSCVQTKKSALLRKDFYFTQLKMFTKYLIK